MNPRICDILNVRSEVREGRIVGVVKVNISINITESVIQNTGKS